MALWICLVVGVALGMLGGGWRAIRAARGGDFAAAERTLMLAARIAGGCGMLAAALTLGWPFRSVTTPMPVEVTRTVVEAVTVPFLYFWSATERRERLVTETVFHDAPSRQFDPLLVLPLLGVGWACARVERLLVRRAWSRFG